MGVRYTAGSNFEIPPLIDSIVRHGMGDGAPPGLAGRSGH